MEPSRVMFWVIASVLISSTDPASAGKSSPAVNSPTRAVAIQALTALDFIAVLGACLGFRSTGIL